MSVYKRPGQSEYSYDFRYRGTRFSGNTGCTTKREAERYEETVRKQVRAATVEPEKPMTFQVASSLYWDQVGKHHRNHVDTMRSLEWLQIEIGCKLLSTIDEATVARLVAKRRGEGVSAATVNRSVTEPLRAIMRRAGRVWGKGVKSIEWKQHWLPEPQERIREATPDEERALMAAIRGDYAPALRFAILSGCRRAEIVNLKWTAVDFFNKIITVKGKGDRTRNIPMTQAMYDLLKAEHGKDAEAVFTYIAKMPRKDAGKIRPITMEGFKTEWRRARKRSGVQNYRFHDNRHTAATRLVRATGNLKLAQRLLGHTEIATTSRYSHVTDDDLRAGMEAAITTEIHTDSHTKGDTKLKKNGKKA